MQLDQNLFLHSRSQEVFKSEAHSVYTEGVNKIRTKL